MNTPTRPAWVTDRHEAAAVLARRTVHEGALHPAVKRPDDPGLAAFFEATIELAGHALIELDQHAEYDRSRDAIVSTQLIAVSMAEALTHGDQERMGALMPTSIPDLMSTCTTLAGLVHQLVTASDPGMETEAYARMRELMIANNARTPDENSEDES